MSETQIKAGDVKAGDYIRGKRYSGQVAAVRTLSNGQISLRFRTGAWGSRMVGTHQDIERFLPTDKVIKTCRAGLTQ